MSAVARLNATAAPVTGPWLVSNFDSIKEPAWGVKYDFATTLCHEARMVHKPGVTGKLKFPLLSVAMTVNNRLLLNAVIWQYGSAGNAGLSLSTSLPARVVVAAIRSKFVVIVAPAA